MLKYTVIENDKQYYEYCDTLETLCFTDGDEKEIDLLTVLIKDYDSRSSSFQSVHRDPVEIIDSLMIENNDSLTDLASILGVNRSTVSRIMSYQTRLTYKNAAKIAEHYKIRLEGLMRPYELKTKAAAKPKSPRQSFSKSATS